MEIILMIYIAGIYLFTKYFLYLVAIVVFWYIVKFILDKMNKPDPIIFETETNIPGIGLTKAIVEFRMKKFYGLDRQVKYYTTKDYQKFRNYNVGSDRWEKYNEKTHKWNRIA